MADPEIVESDYFELALTRFTPMSATRTVRIKTVAELDEQLRSVTGEALLSIRTKQDASLATRLLCGCSEHG